MSERLTSLAAVKDWLDITTADSDVMLTRLIDAASRFVLNYINWDTFAATDYVENFRGNGKTTMILRNWPVLSVASVGVGGVNIAASSSPVNGLGGTGFSVSDYRLAPMSLNLYGYGFAHGAPSQVSYRAGFQTTDTVTITAEPVVTAQSWLKDDGVLINGVAAVKVTDVPVSGQYSISDWGVYTFAAADVNKTAKITYSYTPADVSFAVAQLVAEWLKSKDRIGLLSKNLGGQESVTFAQYDLSPQARSMLQPYMNVVPL